MCGICPYGGWGGCSFWNDADLCSSAHNFYFSSQFHSGTSAWWVCESLGGYSLQQPAPPRCFNLGCTSYSVWTCPVPVHTDPAMAPKLEQSSSFLMRISFFSDDKTKALFVHPWYSSISLWPTDSCTPPQLDQAVSLHSLPLSTAHLITQQWLCLLNTLNWLFWHFTWSHYTLPLWH